MYKRQDWMHARTYQRIDKIEMMANYCGIEKSDLVEKKSSSAELNKRDTKQIEEILQQTKDKLTSQEGLMFDGDPASPEAIESIPVSYTHLDVYKRQVCQFFDLFDCFS